MNRLGTLQRTRCFPSWRLSAICICVAAVSHSLVPTAVSQAAEQPNIIFILADDQGWNGTSVQMHADLPESKSDFYRTPNLESLASQGMRFSQAYAPGPMCSPTRASLQTGKSPAQLQMTNVGGTRGSRPSQKLILPSHTSTLPTSEITIGETLHSAGYATAWFGKWHLGGEGPGAHGYDESDGPTGNADGMTGDPENPKDIFGITERGIAFMEKNVKANKPFYLQLWHYAVHGPVESKPETEASYAARTVGRTHQSASFAAMTENLDQGVGMIMDKVKELSIDDNTYIVYMSDHGAGRNLSSNAPLNRGKGTLWEGGTRVPLIISGPGVKSGVYCDIATVGWDLFPTFCDLAKIESKLPTGLEGVSLTPLFASGLGNINRVEHPIAFHFPHYGSGPPQSAIAMGRFKLIKFYESNELRLFDLRKDIGEREDLSKKDPERTAMMHQRLKQYLSSINAGLPKVNPDFDPTLAVSEDSPGRRRGGAGGRRGPSPAQIAARVKEITELETALKDGEMAKVGELLAQMKTAMESSPRRPGRPRPGGAGRPSPRQQRENELANLQKAFENSDTKKLRELVVAIKQRFQTLSERPPGRGPGAQRTETEN